MRDTVEPGVSAPALLLTTDKITASNRSRDAYVYVRQSTPSQMVQHTESLARQYELRERAVTLGWPAHQVVVIDADLGRSGAHTDGRLGFKELVAEVGLGKVGIVLGIEVSRLARNNADWYQLLDLCAITDTLIADADGVYHPGDLNDRLVLGLKGTMSEAELHLIKSRLTVGQEPLADALKLPAPPNRVGVKPTQEISERRHSNQNRGRPGARTLVCYRGPLSLCHPAIRSSPGLWALRRTCSSACV